jgi:diadenosine tetraphosphate (Ap4A) HIT family hydrolase
MEFMVGENVWRSHQPRHAVIFCRRRTALEQDCPMFDTGFELDPRLKADTFTLHDLPLCRVLLMNDARFPWLVLVPRRAGISEIFDLSPVDRQQLMAETTQCASALKEVTACDKINAGALGNVIRQLHMHVVARYENDAAWPKPVWGQGNSQFLSDAQKEDISRKILKIIE